MKELVESIAISGPALTKHLQILERAGLITRGRDAQRRPCRLCVKPMREIDAWMESYREMWEESFDRLEVHLKAKQEKQRSGKDGK
ncbi:DNA-binding MarR family transcriptional regulator [Granulicella aggregans]|uniref:DNA-binding MarR family transcriptional regulator n=1 Tax=Granulicella aggregans TaxID=474949 RepID=A0A7W7ZB56_9BACT|nr:DNA-binding MarR family transcriptional regulator [Granulicella aggregans]